MMFEKVGGSFRDPCGHVFDDGSTILRTVTRVKIDEFLELQDKGVYERLAKRGQIVGSEDVTDHHLDMVVENVRRVLRHERLKYISYPYEWSFNQLKDAALLTLNLQIDLLENDNATLSDNTAYNVQFEGHRAVFIDVLSVQKYVEGTPWTGYGQFCQQFLNPLLMTSKLGLDFRHWFRGNVEGIPTTDLCRMLKARHFLSPGVLTHVYMHAKALELAARASHQTGETRASAPLSKAKHLALLKYMRAFIATLSVKSHGTTWGEYETTNTYDQGEAGLKRQFVSEFVNQAKPNLLIDLGCNAGEYSIVSLDAGAENVIGFDFDSNAVDVAYNRSKAGKLNFLPLQLDAFNPSPSQGWRQNERSGFNDRAKSDAMIALAFEHHLAIAKNAPLDQMIDWLVSIAPAGIIEFVPKTDPTVQLMLRGREDIFADYDEPTFAAILASKSKIEKTMKVTDHGRVLFQYQR
ncbi:MAG TPA: 50S ribosomal protein L11 methyltransferase [Hyphomicrobiaceae bacterium]|nr:50S ribosomal protein L11 methyltransferase [Hyphomicrobiaceae bacterium]